MTLAELNRYFDLKDNLVTLQDLLKKLEDAAHPGGTVMTGMPHASGVKDKIGDLAIEIADVQTRISYIEDEIKIHKSKVEDFVNTIEDCFLRTAFQLRFERGLSWKEVACMMGSESLEYSIKQSCYRYLKKFVTRVT